MLQKSFNHPIGSNIVTQVANEMELDEEELNHVLEKVQDAIVDDVDMLRKHPSTSLIFETSSYTQLLCGVEEWNVIDDRAINNNEYREGAASCHAREVQNETTNNERLHSLTELLTSNDVIVIGNETNTDYSDSFDYNDWELVYDFDAESLDCFSVTASGTLHTDLTDAKLRTEYNVFTDSNEVISETTIEYNDNVFTTQPVKTTINSITDNDSISEINAWVKTNQRNIGTIAHEFISENVDVMSCTKCGTVHNPDDGNYVMEYPMPSGETEVMCYECYADVLSDETYFSDRESEVLALLYHDLSYIEIGNVFGVTKGCVAAFKHRISNKLSKIERTQNSIGKEIDGKMK